MAQQRPPLHGSAGEQEHWSKLRERGDVVGMRFLFGVYRMLGRWAFALLLYPVVAYFWLTARSARKASQHYLRLVREQLRQRNERSLEPLTAFSHLMQFAHAMLDKSAVWSGAFSTDRVEYDDPQFLGRFRDAGRGALFIGSHLGNIEVLRACAEVAELKVNALVSTANSPKVNRMVAALSPQALENLIQIDSLGPDSIVKLQDKIRAGEHVAIAADRVSVRHTERSIRVPFLGQPAPFPEGPFILASLLACPVYLIFCLRIGEKYKVFFEPFADPLDLPRAQRRAALERTVARYAQRLEAHCLLAPTQWFNFFDFWGKADGESAD